MKTVVSDLDGTLLADGSLNKETIAVLKEFQSKNRLVLATGRNFESVKWIVDELEMEKYQTGALILINGLAFYDFKDREYIYLNSFDLKEVKKIIKIAYRLFFRVTVVCQNERITLSSLYDKIFYILRYLIKHKPIPKQNNEAVYNQVEKIELGGTIFFNFFFKLLKKRLYNYEVVRVSQYWIEILPKGTNKLDQLKYLVSKYHIDQNDLYVFGDGENDIEMLQYANNSYAPENALIEAKNAAHFKCESCNNNGVIKVIQNIIKR